MEGGEMYDVIFKLVIIGEQDVGKTKIMRRFVLGTFDPASKPTIGVEFMNTDMRLDEKTVRVAIWDTAGQERFRALASPFYRGAHGAIVVYDITNRATFLRVREWLAEFRNYAEPRARIALVGNKVDIVDAHPERRKVSTAEGLELAEAENMAFIETSAATGTGVQDAFTLLIRQIYREQVGTDEHDDDGSVDDGVVASGGAGDGKRHGGGMRATPGTRSKGANMVGPRGLSLQPSPGKSAPRPTSLEGDGGNGCSC